MHKNNPLVLSITAHGNTGFQEAGLLAETCFKSVSFVAENVVARVQSVLMHCVGNA